ncbi:MAG: TonB family protein [Alloprevotella sp.]|nr:TonB family protein [Prevotellamassilia sp.]MDY2779231.1 TonB family protein [Alloprevotella sp.]MDD7564052.1 TonB family protein [Prevotellamassilia sp.]MDY4568467.1 TonB family protein [Alloprevotella sp.]MDY5762164.1 TonB family protein [Alloprevotella sp.]
MSKIDLISKGWCDIVFEGRNKEYGAYRMRARAGARNVFALIVLLAIILAIGVFVALKAVVSELAGGNEIKDESAVELSQLKKEEPKKKEEKKIEIKYEEQKVEKVAVKASIQFTVPKIEDDALVDETKEVKSQDKVTKSNISIASQDYAGDAKGGINIDDLKDNQRAGGTEVKKQEEEVADNSIVEVPASYPGGEAALLKFVSDNLVYPSIAQDQDLQGTVVLRFRVEKDGSIGQIVVKKSLSKECDQAAAQVVSKLKRFTPARQQGHPVPVWFTLPIRFRIQ